MSVEFFLIVGLVGLGALVARRMKERTFLYCMACGMFLLGAVAAGSGVLAGIRGNHWEIRYRKGGDSWYQQIGIGLVLITGSIYLARRDWPKKEPNQPLQPTPVDRRG